MPPSPEAALRGCRYGLREALAISCEEGLPALWERHQRLHARLWEGLTAIGLEPFVENPENRLATVNTIKVPEGVDWAKLNAYVMDKYRCLPWPRHVKLAPARRHVAVLRAEGSGVKDHTITL